MEDRPHGSLLAGVTAADAKDGKLEGLPPMPRFELLLEDDKMSHLISEALLLTAERISQGLPIDVAYAMESSKGKRKKKEGKAE
ncbi:MAG: hypothetical protein SGPRY_013528 [Prymnesium sp.]